MHPSQISSYFDILTKSQKAYGRLLEPVCERWALTRSEVDVLLFLYNNPRYDRAADIVTHRGMAKSHVSMSVANLTDRGLLQRNLSQTDRRAAHLQLTEQGRKIAAEARAGQKAFFSRIYAGISPEEQAVWEQISGKIRKNIEEFDKP